MTSKFPITLKVAQHEQLFKISKAEGAMPELKAEKLVSTDSKDKFKDIFIFMVFEIRQKINR